MLYRGYSIFAHQSFVHLCFSCLQIYCPSELVSPLIPCSSQCSFYVWQKCHDSGPGYLFCLFLCCLQKRVSPIKSFEGLGKGFVLSCALSFSFFFSSINVLRIRVCIGLGSSRFPGISGVGNQKVIFCCSGSFVVKSLFR